MDGEPGRRLPLPRVHGLKGHSVTLAANGVPAHALFVDYRMADGRRIEPEIFPRPGGEVYVCGMADPAPLPDSPDAVEVSEEACAVLARAAGRVSTRLAAARVTRRQACYRPVTDDGLPLIGPVPGVADVFVATGHGPWGMLNAPATGQALAELIVEGAASSVDLRPFDPVRLSRREAAESPTRLIVRGGRPRRGTALGRLTPRRDDDHGQRRAEVRLDERQGDSLGAVRAARAQRGRFHGQQRVRGGARLLEPPRAGRPLRLQA